MVFILYISCEFVIRYHMRKAERTLKEKVTKPAAFPRSSQTEKALFHPLEYKNDRVLLSFVYDRQTLLFWPLCFFRKLERGAQ